tara:strand:+ start:1633 stop:1908 length:276 start_codon:yes stop_codon:yes gene_type:complete
MDDNALVGIIFLVVIASFFYVARKKDINPSNPVGNAGGPTVEEKREEFSKMTVPKLKTYVKENKTKLKDSKGRIPTKKADLIEASMEIWNK